MYKISIQLVQVSEVLSLLEIFCCLKFNMPNTIKSQPLNNMFILYIHFDTIIIFIRLSMCLFAFFLKKLSFIISLHFYYHLCPNTIYIALDESVQF